jgi:hypothetical protein
VKRFVISLALFTLLPVSVCADQVVNLPYNYSFKGSVAIPSLAALQCMATDANKKVVSSGGLCGGGGGTVTSVSGTAQQINVANGTTTPVVSIAGNPVIPGLAASLCVKTNFVFQLTTAQCVHSVVAGTNVTITGTAVDPVINASSGGGVTSVTAGPSGNLTFAPTTGAVIGDIIGNPSFAGAVTSLVSLASAFVSTNTQFAQWKASTADTILQTSNGTFQAISPGPLNSAFGISDSTNGFNLMSLSTGGDVGFRLGVHADNAVLANLTPGQCLQASGSKQIISSGALCPTSSPLMPFTWGVSPPVITAGGPNNVAATSYGLPDLYAPVGNTIHNLNVTCSAFNATDAGGTSNYNPLDANGLGGYTTDIAVVNASFSVSAPHLIGSVIIPTSPQAGPWVTSVTTAVTPYNMLAGDSLTFRISSPDAIATQWVAQCSPSYN